MAQGAAALNIDEKVPAPSQTRTAADALGTDPGLFAAFAAPQRSL